MKIYGGGTFLLGGSTLPTQVGRIGKEDRLAGTFSGGSTVFGNGPFSGGLTPSAKKASRTFSGGSTPQGKIESPWAFFSGTYPPPGKVP